MIPPYFFSGPAGTFVVAVVAWAPDCFSRSRHPIIFPPSFISFCILILHHSASNPFAPAVISCDPPSDPLLFLPFHFVDTGHCHVTYCGSDVVCKFTRASPLSLSLPLVSYTV